MCFLSEAQRSRRISRTRTSHSRARFLQKRPFDFAQCKPTQDGHDVLRPEPERGTWVGAANWLPNPVLTTAEDTAQELNKPVASPAKGFWWIAPPTGSLALARDEGVTNDPPSNSRPEGTRSWEGETLASRRRDSDILKSPVIPGRPTVGLRTLNPPIQVRILAREPDAHQVVRSAS